MEILDKVSTGLIGFDQMIDKLRLGDNVVWQVDSVAHYKEMVAPYVAQAKLDKRNLVYVRFGRHEPLLNESGDIKVYAVDPKNGFESFATEVHKLIEYEGKKAFYVFDCLTDLLEYWYSDLMLGNFFKVTCPYLYELDTIAYFAIKRNVHTYSTIAGIRDTTQLLLDLYKVNDKCYIHPLKVWKRYSSTMFFPHLIDGQEAVCITGSSESTELFSSINRRGEIIDNWDVVLNKAIDLLSAPPDEQEKAKKLLMSMIIGNESRMLDLCNRYFTLKDIIRIASREVGSGFIGGKSVGMLIARKILEKEAGETFDPYMEPHDSYYLGSDIFYTYIVQNGCWELRIKQKTKEGYLKYAKELQEKILNGRFHENIQDKFIELLEYFGQSPIIVRSSSLLEDNFGNAFAGKYESVFCVNQGTPEERYNAFAQAVRIVYASTMNEDALAYRLNRGLSEKDEQMAILVQRVSGDNYNDDFFPHVAGVGNSSNLYVWDESIDMDAGMLRMVLGLGTRAVDRTVGDYARIVCLDNPMRLPPMNYKDQKKFSQYYVDVLSLEKNQLISKNINEILSNEIKANKGLFAALDQQAFTRMKELGLDSSQAPYILDFKELLGNTKFPKLMKDMLSILSRVYNYPVDIEFTANFKKDDTFKINLLQCRPLQTRGLGKPVELPKLIDEKDCLFHTKGPFIGGNVRLPVNFVVFIGIKPYLALSESGKYAVARQVGLINTALKGKNVMLMGPGRWGTTTPSLGVPVHFTELCNMSVICEVAFSEAGVMPELSYGSHFFQDIVETGIFYVAIFDGQKDVTYNPDRILGKENILHTILPQSAQFKDVIHIARTDGMEIFSDIMTQTLLCK
ncbi:MAG TPA: PEP/pyruvate-binding domain-containing protein [Pseudobacteroides sp.]|uniref:PEP/pyruvate-binding domain-containing protein n=1 Tax=Pseudobacteroides sp. TaxID=1968840 RepID=UPI002F939C18